jgi:hypothetical protein
MEPVHHIGDQRSFTLWGESSSGRSGLDSGLLPMPIWNKTLPTDRSERGDDANQTA